MDFLGLYLLFLLFSIVVPFFSYKKYKVSSIILIVMQGLFIVGSVVIMTWVSLNISDQNGMGIGYVYVFIFLIVASIPMYAIGYISLFVEFIIKAKRKMD
ncbi:hypothetical protein [Paenibacillus sp. IHBB 10380]|uniref:hypothetical protein n=1 Tax=Paenibacillus sp. IHBB 10380 TaxID=1566358 RepID=UPI0005CFC92C|nr:hypothetical protein [Paenibacillus sp. IHBB 10380]AJS59391.1 hypothetical protein UB51_13995 [Paenibacillus sp. IHBB 10380]